MAREPMVQDTFILPSDPYIRDSRSSVVEPGYIRDTDLESGFVRYPRAGGRLIEKGVGALMDDPLGLVTGALSGIVDQARESGDPLSFLQDTAVGLGSPIVESGERLASCDYEGLTLEEEEEARLLDALTVAELVPLLGLGIKGVTGALRRRLRVENPGVDDAEIEAIMAQMEQGPGDPGGEDLGPRSEQLGLDETEPFPLAVLEDIRDVDESIDVDEAPVQAAELAVFDAELARLEADQANDFGFGDDATRDFESAIEDRLNLELGRYFGDNDMMTTSDALVVIGEDVVAGLDDLGYGAAETFTFIDNAMERGGYTEGQRRQLMDELFPPVATEPGQPGLGELAGAVQEAGLFTDPVAPELQRTPMNQLEAMDFSLTGNDTKLNSRFEEVVLAPGAPKKFKNKQEFINYLTNNKNGVTNAEIEARGIDLLGDGPIDLDDPDVRRWVFRDPLKVRILDGADVQYKGYFLRNPTDYRETIITLDGSPFDADMVGGGIVGDSKHYGITQQSMGGPELLHMRTGQFEVLDPPTTEKPATVAGKTFHVGEIQSQATQDARKYRQARKNMESLENDFVGGADKLSEDLELIGGVIKRKDRLDYLRSQIRAVKIFPHDTDPEELAELEATARRVDSGLKDELERIGYDSVDEALEYRDAFIKRMEQIDEKSHTYNTARNSLNYLLSFATDVNVDDLGVGSLYQTDRITNIAVKQALEQAIDTGADFITFNRGDLVHGMTGGKLEGHKKYYDNILPKNVNKLMEKLEKQHKVKLPRLEDLRLKTESGPELGLVKGFKLTPELRKIFKEGVQAFKSGGMVKVKSLGIGSMGREVLL